MKTSIRLQLTFWYIGSISLVILLFGAIAYFSLKTILIRNIDGTLYNSGRLLEQTLSEYMLKSPDDPHSLSTIDDNEEVLFSAEIDQEAQELFFTNHLYIQLLQFPDALPQSIVVIAKTATLANRMFPLSPRAYQAVTRNESFAETLTDIFPFPLRVVSLRVQDQDGRPYIAQLGLSVQDIRTTLDKLLVVFGVLFPVIFAMIASLGYVFMKQAFSPVKKMVAVTRSITAEDLSLRLDPLNSRDEIGELADTLNDMIARLERSFQQIRQFSGDVSHELKTPLAELKCNAEVALRKERPPQEYRAALHNIVEDTEQLQHIVEDLLLLARMDSGSQSSTATGVAVHDVFLEVFERLQPFASQKGIAVEFEEMEQGNINGDAGLIRRLFTNLIENAIRYTPSNGKIRFALHRQEEHVVVTIADTGIGIPEEHLPRIFDRFYRVEQSRSHETGGSGLGLAIAHKIVELHRGHLDIQSTMGEGTTVYVSLPSAA